MAGEIDLSTSGAYNATRTVLQGKYNEAITLATWAQGVLEGKLAAIATKDEQFDITAFYAAAEAAIDSIPVLSAPGAIAYTSPGTAPTINDALTLDLPSTPTWDDVTYVSPTQVTAEVLDLTVPTKESLLGLVSPTLYTAGSAPDTTVTFNNADFANSLMEALQAQLTSDLGTGSTGLGDAEAALFDRAVQRERDTLLESYNQITTQFSARGFDMPPGAINALIAQESNKATIRLTDVNASILETSAKLAQAWNQTTVTASTQLVDILARVFDSRIMRDFEAAKSTVMLTVEAFKAKLAEVTTNAQLEGTYLSSITAYNDGVVKQFTGELSAETTRLSAVAELNRSRYSDRNSQVQALTTEMGSKIEKNKGLSSQYLAAIQGEVTRVTTPLEVDKAKVQLFSSEIQSATAEMQAQAETEKAIATVGDINSRRALGLADLASKFALSNIDQAVRKYMTDVETLKASAQTAAQMISSAIGSVNSGATLGFQASVGTRLDNSVSESYSVQGTASPPLANIRVTG